MFLPCRPCCGPQGCGVADGKPRTDPATEGHWVPSGTWASGVTWTFSSSPSTTDGGTWYFYGSAATSKVGGGATTDEQQDWGNICNWYSNKTTTPSNRSGLTAALDKRATRLPPDDAIVHVYTNVNTGTLGSVTVKNAFFWVANLAGTSVLDSTDAVIDSAYGVVFVGGGPEASAVVNSGALFYNATNYGTVNDSAVFMGVSGFACTNAGTVNDSCEFRSATNSGTVNGGAVFTRLTALSSDGSSNGGTVNGGAHFYGTSYNYNGVSAVVNGGAEFHDNSINGRFSSASPNPSYVYDGSTFYDSSQNLGYVDGGALFYNSSINGISGSGSDQAIVYGGANFYDSSVNARRGRVDDGATFHDLACSTRFVGVYSATPCTKKFVTHPTDLPTCNGTAPSGCSNPLITCGCG